MFPSQTRMATGSGERLWQQERGARLLLLTMEKPSRLNVGNVDNTHAQETTLIMIND